MHDLDPPRRQPSGNIPPRFAGALMLGWGLFSLLFGGVLVCTAPIAVLDGEEVPVIVLAMIFAGMHVLVGLLNIAAGAHLRRTNYPSVLSWLALLSNFATCLFCGWIPVMVMAISAASFLTAKRDTF